MGQLQIKDTGIAYHMLRSSVKINEPKLCLPKKSELNQDAKREAQ